MAKKKKSPPSPSRSPLPAATPKPVASTKPAESTKPTISPNSGAPSPEADVFDAPGGHSFRATREMIESIVVAFVLAFLFRTFEAEAFVIPTGSMSPALLGQHKDINCPHCGHRFRVSASSEGADSIVQVQQRIRALKRRGNAQSEIARLQAQVASQDIVGGVCPMCRYLTPCRDDLPANVSDVLNPDLVRELPTYPGDRILVNKYGYDFHEPERWDVVVFKFPGDGNMNYIKRLVGMPGESLQIYQGDLFARPLDDAKGPYKILRKPPHKVAAMLQLVHDSDFEPSTLFNAGWPLRWAATTPNGWKVETTAGPLTVQQKLEIDQSPLTSEATPSTDDVAWLRYRHILPDGDDWFAAEAIAGPKGLSDEDLAIWKQAARPPRLINDFNCYNALLQRNWAENYGWRVVTQAQPGSGSLGTEWVGDLALECDVEVKAARGELVLDVVEAGFHFRAAVNLTSGKVALSIVDGRTGKPLDFHAEGETPLSETGSYQVRFANVDDALYLWVDGDLIDCGDTTYDPDQILGQREKMIPWSSPETAGDQGDLAPLGVGARGAQLTIDRLKAFRDIYYIATKSSVKPDPENDHSIEHFTDYTPIRDFVQLPGGREVRPLQDQQDLFALPDAWLRFLTRKKRTFENKAPDQFFVMGDNSPQSQDCRLWFADQSDGDGNFRGRPGGSYLERHLLIGEAVCVFWPHSWGGVPGISALPGFPNFGDMRIVR